MSTAAHDPMVCGLGLSGNGDCPGCVEDERNRPPSDDDRREALMLALALPRRPAVLSDAARRNYLAMLLDLAETVKKDPQWADDLRAIVRGILEEPA